MFDSEHVVVLLGFLKFLTMKLTEDQTLQFVSLYREHVCLWDITSESYKNKNMRQSALQKICAEMQIEGFTVEDVKNKIKSMRSTYYLELDKIKKSSTSDASGDVYHPKMKWFIEFNSFIKNAMEYTESQSEDRADEDPFTLINTTQLNPPAAETFTPQSPKKSRLTKLSSIVNNMKELKNDFSNSNREEDEFDTFGKHIAAQLRKLSTEQAIIGQEQIQKVITKCRLNDLKYKNMSYAHIPQAPGTSSMSPASTTDAQTTDDSLDLFCDDDDTHYAPILLRMLLIMLNRNNVRYE